MYVALPENSPLAGKDVVTLSDLRDYTWISVRKESSSRDVRHHFASRCGRGDCRPGRAKVLTAEDAAQLVSENLGVALLSMVGGTADSAARSYRSTDRQ
jgi:DNA-binding transcriptional LysR family regulator